MKRLGGKGCNNPDSTRAGQRFKNPKNVGACVKFKRKVAE
jgi:hypothetical protein